MWFWEISPKYWTPVQWGIFAVAVVFMFAVCLFGCGIDSIVELVL